MVEVSHGDLHEQISGIKTDVAVIKSELDGQDRMIRDTQREVSSIKDTLSEGKARFAEIGQNITGIHSTLLKMDGRLESVIASDNQRKGRDGVIREILKSPVTGWISALAICIGGFVAWFLTIGASG